MALVPCSTQHADIIAACLNTTSVATWHRGQSARHSDCGAGCCKPSVVAPRVPDIISHLCCDKCCDLCVHMHGNRVCLPKLTEASYVSEASLLFTGTYMHAEQLERCMCMCTGHGAIKTIEWWPHVLSASATCSLRVNHWGGARVPATDKSWTRGKLTWCQANMPARQTCLGKSGVTSTGHWIRWGALERRVFSCESCSPDTRFHGRHTGVSADSQNNKQTQL